MVFWFAGMAFLVVWTVFRDTAIDYRLVALGAVLPDAVDVFAGGARFLHSLLAAVCVLVVVMLVTRRRRVLRRQLLALPIGLFCHLLLDGMWARTGTFWWPLIGDGFDPAGRLPSLERPVLLVVVQEAAGLAAIWWGYRRFWLFDPTRRQLFARTGRFDRNLRTEEPPAC